MTFTVRYVQHEGVARLHLTGELDLATAPEFNAVVDRLLQDGQPRLLVDLRDLAFCDSAGMAAFVRGDSLGTSRGGWLRLTGATGRVARVLRISGLDEFLRYGQEQGDPAVLPER